MIAQQQRDTYKATKLVSPGPSSALQARCAHQRRLRSNMLADKNIPCVAGPSSRRVSLPSQLPRPNLDVRVDAQRVWASSNELKETPLEYIRAANWALSQQYLAGIQSTQINLPQTVPHEVDVTMHDMINVANIPPTHVLAVLGARPQTTGMKTKTKVILFPIHQTVFTSHCTKFPSNFPPSPPSSEMTLDTFTLPVVKCALPSPETFGLLSSYIYLKDVDILYTHLLPTTTTDIRSILQKACAVMGIQANARSLGLCDTYFFDVIDQIWETILERMHLASAPLA